MISVLLGSELEATERAALDRAITATYQRVGITSDPRTWTRPAPLLADLAEVLADTGDLLAVQTATACNDVTWPRSISSYAQAVARNRAAYPLTAGMPANIFPCAFGPATPPNHPRGSPRPAHRTS